jgi:hypothetical protein
VSCLRLGFSFIYYFISIPTIDLQFVTDSFWVFYGWDGKVDRDVGNKIKSPRERESLANV